MVPTFRPIDKETVMCTVQGCVHVATFAFTGGIMAAPAGPPLSLHIAIVMRRKPPLDWVIHGRFRSAGHQIGWRALVPSALVRVKPVRRSGMFRSVVTVMSRNGRKLLVRGAGLLKRTARLFRRPLFSDSVIQDTTP